MCLSFLIHGMELGECEDAMREACKQPQDMASSEVHPGNTEDRCLCHLCRLLSA